VIAFLVDQNFNAHIVNGLTRRNSLIELIHVRDIGLAAADDSVGKGCYSGFGFINP
jgi:predicted nuclease of predicted toxin-antitoxin system